MSCLRAFLLISTPPQLAGALDAAGDRAFVGLADAPALLLAVSGGPDSMALMHLAAVWARRLAAKPKLYVATVDHGLRLGSAAEADMVAVVAASLNLPHAILSWAGSKPTSRLQEKARVARYGLLADHARQVGASHVLTAHHADDQAETMLLRLGRGSGITGLAGVRRLSPLKPGLCLCRPLLGHRKTELVDYCDANAIRYIDDPSNHDPAFARTRLRTQSPVLAQLGIETLGLVRLARRLARADDALEAQTDRIERALQPVRSPGSYSIDLKSTTELAPEFTLRLLGRAVAHVVAEVAAQVAGEGAGSPRAIRLERLESLAEAVRRALQAGTTHRGTLAGTRVVLDADGRLHVTREPRRHRGMAPSPTASDRLD